MYKMCVRHVYVCVCVCERLDIPIPSIESISMSSIPIYLSCICIYNLYVYVDRSKYPINKGHRIIAPARLRASEKPVFNRARHRHL